MTPARPCKWCEKMIVVRTLRGGRAWPFNQAMASIADAGDGAFVPVSSGGRVVMVPIAEMSPKRLAAVRWVATRHHCAQWAAAHRHDLTGVEDLASAVARVLGLSLDDQDAAA